MKSNETNLLHHFVCLEIAYHPPFDHEETNMKHGGEGSMKYPYWNLVKRIQ